MERTNHGKVQTTIINVDGSRKVVLLNPEAFQLTEQAKHRKANTQNLNIHAILHNEQQTTQDPPYNTCDGNRGRVVPSRVPKLLPRNKHELALENELKAYKAEVEHRYHNSVVNGVFVFPRALDLDGHEHIQEPGTIDEATGLSEQCKGSHHHSDCVIPTSIYDAVGAERHAREGATHVKTRSGGKCRQEGSFNETATRRPERLAVNQELYQQVQNILNSAHKKDSRNGGQKERSVSKEIMERNLRRTLYNTQMLALRKVDSKPSGNGSDASKSYLENTMRLRDQVKKQRYPTNNVDSLLVSDKSRQPEDLSSLVSMDTLGPTRPSKGSHVRNQTVESTVSDGKNLALKRLIRSRHADPIKSKSRTKTQALPTNYFRSVVNQKAQEVYGPPERGRPVQPYSKIKSQHKYDLSNVFSMTSLNNISSGGKRRNPNLM